LRLPLHRSLTIRLLAFNLLLLFLPLASLLYLDSYERQLLDMQEASMIQQARIFASALSGVDLRTEAAVVLKRLGGRVDARIRVVDAEGRLLADSAGPAPREAAAAQSPSSTERLASSSAPAQARLQKANETLAYRVFTTPLSFIRRITQAPSEPFNTAEFYSGQDKLLGSEVRAALEGRYGAATRLSTGGQVSVQLYSAIPIEGPVAADGGAAGEGGERRPVVGAVLVSRSTYGILVRLYRLRLDIIRVFMYSLAASAALSIVLAMTITRPVAALRRQAENALDGRGRLKIRFTGLKRKDEIGELSRALAALSERLERRMSYAEGFTADLMHELKNPLASIRGALELSLSSGAKETALLAGALAEERRMERLLAGLRDIGRVDSAIEREERSIIDLASFVPRVLERYHGSGREPRFELRDSGPIPIEANPDRLVQLIVNPVDNALSFSPESGSVVVAVGLERGVPFISVEDRGPGFAEPDGAKLFERFYSDRPSSDASEHTGLGLAVVKAIADAYGAFCTIENRAEGGCRLRILFKPAARD
jgi:two-component system sensor histidine kinase ChvG